jgi:hypothetical protein
MVSGKLIARSWNAFELVRHLVAGAAEILRWRVEKEIRYPRRIKARVLFHLRAEARLLILFFQERSPEGVEALIDAPFDRVKLAVDEAQAPAHAVDCSLDARALRVDSGHVEAVRPAVRVLYATRQFLEATLVEAQLVLEAIARVFEFYGVREVLAA